MGYSIRNKDVRYTLWLAPNEPETEELYVYDGDGIEKENIVDQQKYTAIKDALKKILIDRYKLNDLQNE